MTKTILRGRLLSFLREPQGVDDFSSFSYYDDGALLIENGLIKKAGDYSSFSKKEKETEVINHRPHLIMPGFIDTHNHFPQIQVIASWGAQLLDWLENYTFPEEMRFGDPDHANNMANAYFDFLIAHGTTTPVAYCSAHVASVDAYFAEAKKRNIRAIGGKVMMDRNAPEALCDTSQSAYEDSKKLIEKWHNNNRALYAISPRFAITSTPEQLEMAGALASEFSDCHIQTHLSENKDEIELAAKLYPQSRDYLDIYQQYGLVGEKTLLGHAIHLAPREIDAIAKYGAKPVFCPTSNLFLGSGLFDNENLRKKGILNGIATDFGGGTSYSMLKTLDEGYKILQLQGQRLHPFQAFYWITRGNAAVLGLEDKIGTLEAGSEADLVILDPGATPAMALRMERVQSLGEELFVLQTLGDDRAIIETYIAGKAQKTLRNLLGS